MDRSVNVSNARSYTNLASYMTHPPPYYGKGINAPWFAAQPMRTIFQRGNNPPPDYIQYTTECCDPYDKLTQGDDSCGYVNPKMLRQKK